MTPIVIRIRSISLIMRLLLVFSVWRSSTAQRKISDHSGRSLASVHALALKRGRCSWLSHVAVKKEGE